MENKMVVEQLQKKHAEIMAQLKSEKNGQIEMLKK